ncbi:Gfo/Idh/MocA family protein [[Bacillus] enclensis]|uniref:Gfo/Idh/MocA family protein n=1 Tax=[Bacillus] enclensis TaxID=1402860 RepID=UPI0018DC4153|nr:Gfo/Idh/MocA family oxidoreductase [[Bacillus] enclensis]MBH9966116.1 Gfo/Idh/MocA family oxidoreductase [[Bacillus] enclensis]
MSDQKVKIAVAGAGSFTDLWYLPILKKHPSVILKAICSQNGTNADRLAAKYGIPSSCRSYREMLEEDIDGICIVTPNVSHHEIALLAAEKQIHVMCEKPLAMEARQAKAMWEAAERNNIIHGVNFTYRENPAVVRLKELIEGGLIGKVYEGKFEYSGDYGLSGPPGWRGTSSVGGRGGVLADLGSHLIDAVHYILGENIEHVSASLSYLEGGSMKRAADLEDKDRSADSAFFQASFPSGIQGSFYTSWVSTQGDRNQTIDLMVKGGKGALQLLSSELGIRLRYAPVNGPWEDIKLANIYPWDDAAEPSEERFRPWRFTEKNEIWKWVDAINEKKELDRPTFRDGYVVQRVIDSVLLSDQLRKEVAVKELEKMEESQ